MREEARQGIRRAPAVTYQPPFVAGSTTSEQAATEIKGAVANYREQVYQCIAEHGPCTDEEIADRTGINPSTARPRRVDLMRQGRVRASENTRATRSGRQAQAWTVTTPAEF